MVYECYRTRDVDLGQATAMKGRAPRKYTCMNKSLFQALESQLTSCLSSGATPPAVLPTLAPCFVEIQSQLAQNIHRGVLYPLLAVYVAMQLLRLGFRHKTASEAISVSKNFLGEHAPTTLALMLMHAYSTPDLHATKYPGYGPASHFNPHPDTNFYCRYLLLSCTKL